MHRQSHSANPLLNEVSHVDPGLTVDLYANNAKTETTYIIPGPPLYGSGTGAPAPAPPVSLPRVQYILFLFLMCLLSRPPQHLLQLLCRPVPLLLPPLLQQRQVPSLNTASAEVPVTRDRQDGKSFSLRST